tara:strand:- start:218 stop:1699 length:1482 start_codon:yes stop_codon:yes gene_type:complete
VQVTNSGTISAVGQQAIRARNTTNATITNNAGGVLSAANNTILAHDAGVSGLTITNSGTIFNTVGEDALRLENSSGTTITNNAGGEIYTTGNAGVVKLGDSATLTNHGEIRNDTSVNNTSVWFFGDNSTLTIEESSKIVGMIDIESGTTGSTIQVNQGYGQTYFYDTTGTGAYTVQDLSGNAIVKGSAGSVGQGAQESIDERLGLRTYNLRSALKRYITFPKDLIKDEIYVEPFSYYSKRGSNSSILSYENYGYGLNFIYPLKSNKLDLVLTVEKSELEIQRDHDVSNTNFLAGFNAKDFLSLGSWKTSGFLVAGMGWHDGKRRIYTNTTTSGLLDVTSDYSSYEVITGSHANYRYSSGATTLDTEIGITLGFSLTPHYNERGFFAWEERRLWQGGVHIGETLTSKVSDNLTVTVGGELEHHSVLRGRKQTYTINGTTADTRHGQFWQNSVAGKLGANYSMNNNMVAYVNLDSRFSNLARGTYGASVGLSLNF